MTLDEFVSSLIEKQNQADRISLIEAYPTFHSDALAAELKAHAMQVRSSDLPLAQEFVALIYHLSKITQSAKQRAYGYWVDAVIKNVNQGQYQEALDLYDKAIAIFQNHQDALSVALMQISQIWALSRLARNDEALSTSKRAEQVLRRHEAWYPLATLAMNTANIFRGLGKPAKALRQYEEVQLIYEGIRDKTPDVWEHLGLAIFNQGICHSDLGDYITAVTAFEKAIAIQVSLKNNFDVAQIKQYWGVTYLGLGRYSEALKLLNAALAIFETYDSKRHTARASLYIAKCFLQMRRLTDAYKKSDQAQTIFHQTASPYEEGESYLIKAAALAGQRKFERALTSLQSAKILFQGDDEGEVWRAFTDLETSLVLYELGRYSECENVLKRCIPVLEKHNLSMKEAECYLIQGDVSIAKAKRNMEDGDKAQATDQLKQAQKEIRRSIQRGETDNVLWLLYRGFHSLGRIYKLLEQPQETEKAYIGAVDALEQLRSYLMIEYRSPFQEDKQVVYEELVDLYLDHDIAKAYEYTERAKSRALLDILSLDLDLDIKVVDSADQPLIEELRTLRTQHNVLKRQMHIPEESLGMAERTGNIHVKAEDRQIEINQIETKIAALWHQLLSNRSDLYAHDASLAQVRVEPVQPLLDNDVVIVEYFAIHDQIVVFLVDRNNITAKRLTCNLPEVTKLSERFMRNCRQVPHNPYMATQLKHKAQIILNEIYQALIEPIADAIQPYRQLIIVPHNVLHYLPFHALYDRSLYLIERYAISYLPSASILKYCQETEDSGKGLLAIGYQGQNLKHAVIEAKQVASLYQGDVVLDTRATIKHLKTVAHNYKILHLATHAHFNEAEPLFSGLQLEDGWLSTFDIFDLELNASLVTLSACQTGQHKIAGGDELLGLMRAFIYAGTASLVLTHWPVADHSTSLFMQSFYQHLLNGYSKAAALQKTQCLFIQNDTTLDQDHDKDYSHPYFWAPFFLVGESQHIS